MRFSFRQEETIETREEEPPKEESERVKAFKKGAGVVGGFFRKGWGVVKSGAKKANDKFLETEVVFSFSFQYSLVRKQRPKLISSSKQSLHRRLLKEPRKQVPL